jgi:Skp family chaperone for outer membrane proteins
MIKTRDAGAAAMAAAVLMTMSPAMAASAPAAAPAAAPAPAAPPAAEFGGPSIAGVCLLSKQELVAGSKLGIATREKLQRLHEKFEAGVSAAKASLNAQAKTLAAQRATLPQIQFEQKARALEQREQALQTQTEEKAQQLEATQAKALQNVLETAKPIIADVYRNRGCGVLFDRSSVMAGGLGMDLTGVVIQALDAKATTPPEF